MSTHITYGAKSTVTHDSAKNDLNSTQLGVTVDLTRGPRRSTRCPLQARVIFRWKDENGIDQQGEGHSRDISGTGAFVLAAACPSAGTSVSLSVFLPALPGAPRALQMDMDARVLRIEQACGAKATGFAVASEKVILREKQ